MAEIVIKTDFFLYTNVSITNSFMYIARATKTNTHSIYAGRNIFC